VLLLPSVKTAGLADSHISCKQRVGRHVCLFISWFYYRQ